MTTYTERLRDVEARQAAAPKREYLSNAEYAKLKGALTRAKNSGDGRKVLAAVEKAVERFDATIWPDSWASWRIALEDASQDARMAAHDADADEYDRLMALSDELYAASHILFRF
jgi:hypothetical protein